ncbi:MAG TPA: hypothetical protein VN450_07555, partial [Candidatus Methylomirabilis sp.]|nr:hypothetical protein [Candidatus Methylomirabilis sp.]
PAAAAAALVVVIVHYGGMRPGVPTTARDGLVPGQAGMPRVLSPRPGEELRGRCPRSLSAAAWRIFWITPGPTGRCR